MDITIEKVEKLMEVAAVSYEEAKDALIRADGDLLDAIIILEQDGKINKGTGAYSTNEDSTSSSNNAGGNYNYSYNYNQSNPNSNENVNNGGNYNHTYSNPNPNPNQNKNYKYKDETTDFGDFMKSVGLWLGKILKASLNNSFDVFRYGERILHVPVLALVVLMLAGFWMLIPLLLVGLFFSCRYSFSGPDLGKENVRRRMDEAMNVASDAAETVKESIKQSQQNQQKKQNQQSQYQYQQNQYQQNQNAGFGPENSEHNDGFNNNTEGSDTNGREDINN